MSKKAKKASNKCHQRHHAQAGREGAQWRQRARRPKEKWKKPKAQCTLGARLWWSPWPPSKKARKRKTEEQGRYKKSERRALREGLANASNVFGRTPPESLTSTTRSLTRRQQ